MWESTGRFVLKFRFPLLILLLGSSFFMAWNAAKVQLSYEFTNAIPTTNPKYKAYQAFRSRFGEDGNLMVIGLQTDRFYTPAFFNDYRILAADLKKIGSVEDVLSIPGAVNLVKDSSSQKLLPQAIFPSYALSGEALDSCRKIFENLPFYRGLLYSTSASYPASANTTRSDIASANTTPADTVSADPASADPASSDMTSADVTSADVTSADVASANTTPAYTAPAYLTGIRINKQVLNSAGRTQVVNNILARCEEFSKKHKVELHYSGLPMIRTTVANMVAAEMKWFLIGSLFLCAIILLAFFRSMSNMLLSLGVVMLSVVWSVGTIVLLGYKITLLTALIPPLIVVIGIPNCIYFLNKYHSSFNELSALHPAAAPAFLRREALVRMISKMGIVTLFCNISAAIGFAVFALTKSPILREFGAVAGVNILVIFLISFILIPVVLSMLPPPKARHVKYLDNKRLLFILDQLEHWSLNNRRFIYGITGFLVIAALVGMTRLRSEGFIVDDLPKTDKIYTDLKFFEHNFKGVMPLEILIDTKRKNGLRVHPLQTFESMDSLSQFIAAQPEMARPLSIVEGLKFARQAYYDGDSSNYGLPNSFDIAFLASYLNTKADPGQPKSSFNSLVSSFMDSTKQYARMSVNMQDIGSRRLPEILDTLQTKADQYFDSSKYTVQFTGGSVSFLEGTSFIIHGLKESILWAFLLISLCMLYLFRSLRILICSLIPNIIPLIITAGVMGWAGVPLKPSTVLIFSVALGIAIDITIRFLVNYKQELNEKDISLQQAVISTIHSTGISILYTSLVLTAGFVIFCFSDFGGTKALGWLTSLTLVVATFTNLILLPALLITVNRRKKQQA